MFTVRRIELPELRKLRMAHPAFADSGWAVVEVDDDGDETVVNWCADRADALRDADERNASDE